MRACYGQAAQVLITIPSSYVDNSEAAPSWLIHVWVLCWVLGQLLKYSKIRTTLHRIFECWINAKQTPLDLFRDSNASEFAFDKPKVKNLIWKAKHLIRGTGPMPLANVRRENKWYWPWIRYIAYRRIYVQIFYIYMEQVVFTIRAISAGRRRRMIYLSTTFYQILQIYTII